MPTFRHSLWLYKALTLMDVKLPAITIFWSPIVQGLQYLGFGEHIWLTICHGTPVPNATSGAAAFLLNFHHHTISSLSVHSESSQELGLFASVFTWKPPTSFTISPISCMGRSCHLLAQGVANCTYIYTLAVCSFCLVCGFLFSSPSPCRLSSESALWGKMK